MLSSTYNKIWSIKNNKLILVRPETYVVRGAGDDLYYLAKDFKENVNLNEMFLTDPLFAESGWFQFISERNCYAVYKALPASKSKITEWYNRIMKTQNLFLKNVSEIVDIMYEEQIRYILVKKDFYAAFEESEYFSKFLKSPNDLYRIYQVD